MSFIQNVVSTADLACNLDLRQVTLKLNNVEYNPKKFPAMILRIRKPRTTALVYQSGKIVCNGAKTEEQARLAARKFARLIQRAGYNVKFRNFCVHNIVASCNMGFAIDLVKLASAYKSLCTYEPEIFPGLALRLESLNITHVIFTSGKLTVTGAKSESGILKSFAFVKPILTKFKKI